MRVQRISFDMNASATARMIPLLPEPRMGRAYEVHAILSDGRESGAHGGLDTNVWSGILNHRPDADQLVFDNRKFPALTAGADAYVEKINGAQWWWTNQTPLSGTSTTVPKVSRDTFFAFPVPVGPLVDEQFLVVADLVGAAEFSFHLFYDLITLDSHRWAQLRHSPIVDDQNYGPLT
jgi:hypothetical protein